MATYVPAKRGVELIFYTGLVSQADAKLLKGSATLAAGDVQVSKDGGAFANLTTLPAVTPAAGKAIKVTLSATEMTADNVTVVFSDAAGAEWCDLIVNVATAARQIDDLAFPTTSGRSLDVTATGAAGIDWANVENPTTALNLSATNIDVDQVVASVSGAVASVTGLTAATVHADLDDIQARLPAALTAGGNIKADALAVSDKTGYALTSAERDATADALLNRNVAGGSSVGRLVKQALYVLRNKIAVSAGTLTVYQTDDTTVEFTATVTTAAGDPVSQIDPA